jgi:lipid-A-disaccharide synthase
MNDKPHHFLIVAGEESGDIHGSSLVRSLKEIYPASQFSGMGGNKMRGEGVETFFDIDKMGAVGLIEVIGEIPHHLKVYRKLAAEISSGKYDSVVLIDYPTLNMRLAKQAARVSLPVFYFISPQIWAWRKGRIKDIKKCVTKMFVVLPFEEAMYLEEGVDAEFLGHPFSDQVQPTMSREEAFMEWDLRAELKTIGLLPGSRKKEVESLLDCMMKAAEQIKGKLPDCQFILPIADSIDPDSIRQQLGSNPLKIRTVMGKSHEVMNCADFLIIASGSATLEAGILGCPMVIVYKLNPITYWIARRLVKTPFIGLVNIVAGEGVVPELLQDEVTPENISRAALKVLQDPAIHYEITSRLLKIRETLGEPGVMRRVAESMAKTLHLKPGHEKISH